MLFREVIMKRRYVYFNILMTLVALILPCTFLKFGRYTEAKYTSISQNTSNIPKFEYLVPSFDEVGKYLKDFSKNYSYFASLYELGRTKQNGNGEGFPIYNLVLSSGFAKPIIVFIGGIYASDLASPLALLQCFTEWTTNIKELAQLLPLYDYHFIPLVNPEGYDFVHQKRRKGESFLWLKNMNGFRKGKSVNILNNFDTHFDEFPKPKSDEHYGGEKPFSEYESMVIRNYILEIKDNIAAVFLMFSSPRDDAITYPFTYTSDKHNSWILLEQLAIHALRNISFDSIAVVSSAEYGGLEGGRMDDWILETLQRSIVLNIQLNYNLKATDDIETIKILETKMEALLKRLVIGSYRDKFLRNQARSIEKHDQLYEFPWKKITE